MTNASCGPSVTRYELQPDQGVKVSRIVGLADDIKLNLAVADLRDRSADPGKAAVGIVAPNQENTAVMLRDLLESPEFEKAPPDHICGRKKTSRARPWLQISRRCPICLSPDRQAPVNPCASTR